jgi:hypothetical protein
VWAVERQNGLKSGRGSSFAEQNFARSVFGNVLFQFFAPEGLKCPAAAIQCVHPGKVGMSALQITKTDFRSRYTCVFSH